MLCVLHNNTSCIYRHNMEFYLECRFKTSSGIVQGFDSLLSAGGQPLLNEYDCPIVELSNVVFTTSSDSIQKPVPIVHECSNTCVFQEGASVQTMEREEIVCNMLESEPAAAGSI